MARIGLRMMPPFPSPSLKFRKAGFPRSGFKASISNRAFPPTANSAVNGLHPFFVLSASTVEFPVLCRGNMVRLSTAVRAALLLCPRGPRSGPSYSVSVHPHLLTPSAPLAGTSRFRRIAVYTRCPRCAFPPRRPTSGSVLSLLAPSRHAVLYDPGESIGCLRPVPSPTALAFA